jgi:hypothetical protein
LLLLNDQSGLVWVVVRYFPGRVVIVLAFATITFIFTAARARGGVRGTGVNVARSNHRPGLASALLLPRLSVILVLALVLLLVNAP